jgi:hypothetical protein
MPFFSAFTPCGLFALSDEEPLAAKLYDTLRRNKGGAENYAADGYEEARAYAEAMALARAMRTQECAYEQSLPGSVTIALEERESEFGLPSDPALSDDERRARLSELALIPKVPTQAELAARLTAIWGVAFLSLTSVSVTPGGTSFVQDLAPVKYVLHEAPASGGGAALVTALLGGAPAVGDRFTFYNGARITPAAISSVTFLGTNARGLSRYAVLGAQWDTRLPAGGIGRTGTYEAQRSASLFLRVTIRAAALAADVNKRARTEAFLARALRGTADFEVVPSDQTSFLVGAGRVGYDIINTV